ncbi:uncharacterized protein PWA37_005451 [Arxiozyma heterogenica]|uniref:uncharacterized protein n=1 Tax=Arxiozyma heterogenica TaxID=278026 RepID=UPI002F207F82
MLVNALNAEVTMYITDFEDTSSLTWFNMIYGQVNIYDNIRNQIDFATSRKEHKLKNDFAKLATVIVRPYGLCTVEKHLYIDGESISASIFDFGLYFFHNTKKLVEIGKGLYFLFTKDRASFRGEMMG